MNQRLNRELSNKYKDIRLIWRGMLYRRRIKLEASLPTLGTITRVDKLIALREASTLSSLQTVIIQPWSTTASLFQFNQMAPTLVATSIHHKDITLQQDPKQKITSNPREASVETLLTTLSPKQINQRLETIMRENLRTIRLWFCRSLLDSTKLIPIWALTRLWSTFRQSLI